VHERYAEQVFELDELVTAIVAKLKDRGLMSPYLRNFVVARVNPLRWIKDEPPPLPEVLKTMRERLSRFNVDKVNQQDLAKMGGAGAPEE
jgi:ParB family chromosome partitioning protein